MAASPPTVAERVAAGDYKNPVAYPEAPKRPVILRTLGMDMTDEQVADLPRARAEYRDARAAYERAWDDGHSSGLAEVAGIYAGLVELVL